MANNLNAVKAIPEEKIDSVRVDPHAFDQAVIAWRAPEYLYYEPSRNWYIIAGLIDLTLVIYALITNAWTMAVVFIVLAGVYYLAHQKRPTVVDIKISAIGIKFGNRLYPYHQIRAFWIMYKPPRLKTLNFQVKNGYVQTITVPLLDQDPVAVRNFLLTQVPEWEGKDESLTDVLIHLFKL